MGRFEVRDPIRREQGEYVLDACKGIGDDVWIGANVVIVPDVTIGAHAIVAAGAVVTRDIPEYAVAAGVPARVIGDRREKSQRAGIAV